VARVRQGRSYGLAATPRGWASLGLEQLCPIAWVLVEMMWFQACGVAAGGGPPSTASGSGSTLLSVPIHAASVLPCTRDPVAVPACPQ
jgi:hypothetical protein